HRRGGDHVDRAARRLRAGHAEQRDARRRLRPADHAGEPGARAAHRAEQLVRLRRQQLLPRLRARGGGVTHGAGLRVVIEGVGVWSPELPGWEAGRTVLRGEREAASGSARPAPALLAANERRRAPDSVLLALEVAQQACAMAGRDAARLPAVFASTYG